MLEVKSESRKDIMIAYLGDMTDFSWQGAKAAQAVLLCEMERGSIRWEDTERIDRVRRAHAQKHVLQVDKIGVGLRRSPGFVKVFNPTLAPIRRIMRSMVISTGIFVPFA